MRLKVLGSSGAEFPGFNPPAFLLDGTMLLDAGTIGSVLAEEAQWKIRNVLITHAHLDHIRSIPFLADNIIIRNNKHTVTVYGTKTVTDTIKKNLLNGSVWPDFTAIPNRKNPVIRLRNIQDGKRYKIDGYSVTAYAVDHSVPCTGYLVEDKKGRRLLYTGDTGPTGKIWRSADNDPPHALIVEVSFPNRMRKTAIMTGHLTASLMKTELGKMKHPPGKILITHPKPQYLQAIRKEVGALGMKNIKILRDGQSITI